MVTAKRASATKRQSKPTRAKGGIALAAPPPLRRASTPNLLALRLVRAAKHQASIAGWSFSTDCMTNHLTPFLEQGSTKLFTANKASDVASVVAMEAATRYFVSRMVMEAGTLGLPELQEITFWNVRPLFCPCFPFC